MPIISLSVSEQLEKDIAAFAKKTKLGKSELARAALARYIDEHYSTLLDPKEHYTASLSIVCGEHHKHDVHEVLHRLAVRSQFHLCLGRDRCIEVFGLSANGKDLLIALQDLERLPKIDKVQLCIDK